MKDRAACEVQYYDSKRRTGRAISGPEIGKQAPLPYGAAIAFGGICTVLSQGL